MARTPEGETPRDGKAKIDDQGYVCPMHPEVTGPMPGRCPKCGMELVPGSDQRQA
jgi:hypothetical protein